MAVDASPRTHGGLWAFTPVDLVVLMVWFPLTALYQQIALPVLRAILHAWAPAARLSKASINYSKAIRTRDRQRLAQLHSERADAEKRNYKAETWVLSRRSGAKNLGPKKRTYGYGGMANPTVAEWTIALGRPGPDGGQEATPTTPLTAADEPPPDPPKKIRTPR